MEEGQRHAMRYFPDAAEKVIRANERDRLKQAWLETVTQAFSDHGGWYRHEHDNEPLRCTGCGEVIKATEGFTLGADDAYHITCAP